MFLIRGLQKLFAFILLVGIVMLVPLAIWVSGGTHVLLSPETYKHGFATHGIYSDILPVTLPTISEMGEMEVEVTTERFETYSASNSDAPSDAPPAIPMEAEAVSMDNRVIQIAQALPEDNWRQVANLLVPPEWLQAQTEQGIDFLFAWINGDPTNAKNKVDMSVIGQRLGGTEGEQAIEIILNSLPPCERADLAVYAELSAGQHPPLCHAEDNTAYQDLLRSDLEATLAVMASGLENQQPTYMELMEADTESQEDAATVLQNMRSLVQAYTQSISLFYLCPAALMALLVVVIVRTFRSFARWLGWVGIFSSMIAVLPLFILPLIVAATLNSSLADVPEMDATTNIFSARLFNGFLVSASAEFTLPVLGQAFLCLMLGIGLLLLSSNRRFDPTEDILITETGEVAIPNTGRSMTVTLTPRPDKTRPI